MNNDTRILESQLDEIKIKVADFVATITINRPAKLNSVTQDMSQELERLAHAINDDSSVRVVVLTGAGERAFSTGSDIRSLDAYDSPWAFRNRTDYCDALRELRKPIIAAINGLAYGGGLETAMICDIRLISTNASLASPEIKLGWIGGGGMSAFLTLNAGSSKAASMLLTGEPITAETALAWGLVSEVHAPSELLPRAQELANTLAARPPIAVETAKANLRAAHTMPFDQAMNYERDLQTICFATDDAAEGRLAFKEKRKAVFHGR